MFKGKNAITICADKKYAADIQSVIDKDIEDKRDSLVYVDGDRMYFSFNAKCKAKKVIKTIEKNLYKTEATIVGNIIFVDFK